MKKFFLKEAEKKDENIRNKGTLILDATCAPQDIRFPQDASLLNEARIKLEKIIDTVFAYLIEVGKIDSGTKKPRTYRKLAKKEFLAFTKSRGRTKNIKKIVKKLLQYAERDLRHVNELVSKINTYIEFILSDKEIDDLKTIKVLLQQQREMIDEKKNSVKDRIVSISQPYVRPIVRGKARVKVEFGAKIQLAIINGYTCLDKISWDNFNEGIYLEESVKKYFNRYGYYPEAILADNIYKTKGNKTFCKENNIRFLGNKTYKEPVIKNEKNKKLYIRDLKARQEVEGKIGVAKRKYTLNLIKTKKLETSETSIGLEILILNIDKLLRLKLAKC